MTDLHQDELIVFAEISPNVLQILQHLCSASCHTFGGILEWCDARGDCAQAVVCPVCSSQFVVDDEELDELLRWTDSEGRALVCGVRWD